MEILNVKLWRKYIVRTYRLSEFGSVSGLELTETDQPQPGRREIVIRVHASSVNSRDLMVIEGKFPFPLASGLVPLSDGAGEVVAVGEDVTRVSVGDRVASTYFTKWIGGRAKIEYAPGQLGIGRAGMLADYVKLDEDSVVEIPSYLTYQEAATLPCAAVTAWNCLYGPVPVQAGEIVLTQGSGGVSVFVTQFAKILGARVIATTSSTQKAQRLKDLGADDVINYTDHPDWELAVRELTHGYGADHVIEIGGVAGLKKSIGASAIGAQISLVGVLGGHGTIDSSAFEGVSGVVSLRRITVGSREDFEAMNRSLDLHRIRPVIDRVFSFSEAPEAFRHLQSGKHIGKIVIAHS
jgi:NADPH:quinone reductase-like Zn-dependent oxidoreductase